MRRLIDWHLIKWKKDEYRKPLIIRGARQVGKTYAVRKLGKTFDDLLEINFELTKDARKIFEKDLNPERILSELSLFSGQKIIPGKTLVFFDEIQESPDAVKSLRYFFEIFPELHIIAAGSLLEFTLEKIGLPVGRVSSLYLFPLSFMEFLSATNNQLLIEEILVHEKGQSIGEAIHLKLLDLVGKYLAIGGMPEAIIRWVKSNNIKESFVVHYQLMDSYAQDFQKYAKKHQIKYLEQLFSQIPHMIGKQFKYNEIHGEYRKRELAPCLDLLCKANVVHRIRHSAGNGLPLGAEINSEWFKLIFLDIALCQVALGLDLSTWFLDPKAQFINRGHIAEAFVAQELLCYSMSQKRNDLFFWKREKRGSVAEVDFLYEYQGKIIPIEVKSGHGSTLKSMFLFLKNHLQSPYGIRFSTYNYSLIEKIDSRPLYAVASIAHEEQKESLRSLI
jgi:predicted AAA+ superfamily ATPase